MVYYRVTVRGFGIYHAVDIDCPKDSVKRENKPDGGWLPKVGPNFPSGISYWTEYGWEYYQKSGLFDWHKSVVKGEVEIEKIDIFSSELLYEDQFQVIVSKDK